MNNDEMAINLAEIVMTADCDFPPDFIDDVQKFINEVYLTDEKIELLQRRLSHEKISLR